MLEENKSRQIFRKTNIYYPLNAHARVRIGGKKYTFFGKFDVLYFLVTLVLIFPLLPDYRRVLEGLQLRFQIKDVANIDEVITLRLIACQSEFSSSNLGNEAPLRLKQMCHGLVTSSSYDLMILKKH